MAAQYKNRPIGDAILDSSRPVAIIEGARAVGKTSLAKNQLVPKGFHYVNLADPDVLRDAKRNPRGWFSLLWRPIIIDEAQLLNELPLLVKDAVDQQPSSSIQFILTGSASIKSDGFGGQDPLIRRSETFKLDPFTEREIIEDPHNLIDDLWESLPNEDFIQPMSHDELFSLMEIGGFPLTVLNAAFTTQDTRIRQTYSDIERILSREVLPSQRIDAGSAKALLQRLLTMPGGILNVSKLSKDLGNTRVTIQNYLARLQDRFLVFPLSNFRLQAHRQALSRPKIHPIDTSFSVCAFTMAGKDIRNDSMTFGLLLESYVVNQILPNQSWSQRRPSAFYWRDDKDTKREVDLVLQHNDEVIGIEVKGSIHVSPNDFDGLRTLEKSVHLKRGYVIYTGDRIIRFGDVFWALPITALWSQKAFIRNDSRKTYQEHHFQEIRTMTGSNKNDKRNNTSMASAANLFISYNHADNDYLDDAFVTFLKAIVKRYQFEHTATLSLFVDKDDISWGSDWRETLNTALETTNFLMPQITPRYLASAACREELFKFNELNRTSTTNRILSMIWQPIDEENLLPVELDALNIVKNYQHLDVSILQDLEPSDKEYKKIVKNVVERLSKVIQDNAHNESSPTTANTSTSNNRPEKGILEEFADLQETLQSFDRESFAAKATIGKIGEAISDIPQPQENDFSSFSRWAQELEKTTAPHVRSLNANVRKLNEMWGETNSFIERYIDYMNMTGNTEQLNNLLPSLSAMKKAFTLPADLKAKIEQFKAFQILTPRFTPIVDAFMSCLDLFSTVEEGVDGLIRCIETANHPLSS